MSLCTWFERDEYSHVVSQWMGPFAHVVFQEISLVLCSTVVSQMYKLLGEPYHHPRPTVAKATQTQHQATTASRENRETLVPSTWPTTPSGMETEETGTLNSTVTSSPAAAQRPVASSVPFRGRTGGKGGSQLRHSRPQPRGLFLSARHPSAVGLL